jgi:alcohol dehydrogenase class IV
MRHEYAPAGYPDDHRFVPHGHSVIVTAPAAFAFTYEAMPQRHHHVAELLLGAPLHDPGPQSLPDALISLMRDVGAARGIADLGYADEDVPALVQGALKQQRLLAVAPREAGPEDLARILRASMANW